MPPLIPFPTQVPWADTTNIQSGLPSQTFKQYLSGADGILRPIISQGGSPRIVLGAAASFNYKPSTGSDITGDGSAGNPWASPAPLYSRYDFGGQAVTLNLLENTATQFPVLSWVGGGSLLVNLGGFSIATTGGGFPTGDCVSHISGSLTGDVTIQNGTLSAVSGTAIRNTAPGLIKIGTNLTFGAVIPAHMIAGGGGTIELTNGYTVSGGGAFHWFVDVLGQITDRGIGKVVTISGTPTFSGGFAAATDAGTIIMLALTFSPATGAFTGPRWSVSANGIVNSGNRGVNFIPGSQPGINNNTGGQYI